DDGLAPTLEHTFRILVYPEAFVLSGADFVFNHWDNSHPELTFPPNMIFLQSDVSDPGVSYPLLYPYYIAHNDYHDDDVGKVGFPYNNSSWTRINGLGQSGISFINTGLTRGLGGALVAINTEGLSGLEASWLCGTIARNSRQYGIDLQ